MILCNILFTQPTRTETCCRLSHESVVEEGEVFYMPQWDVERGFYV